MSRFMAKQHTCEEAIISLTTRLLAKLNEMEAKDGGDDGKSGRPTLKKNNITMAGPSFSLYHKYDEENNAVIFSCAVPVSERSNH